MRTELGAYGSKIAQTPNMDALAQAGALFENAIVCEAMCAPSRASILTGLRPDTTGITGVADAVNAFAPNAVTMPDTFKAAGYETIRIGKVYNDAGDDQDGWTKVIPSGPLEYTSANFLDVSNKRWPDRTTSSDYINAQQAVSEMTRLKSSGKPFFFSVGFFRPHMPLIAPSEDWDRYDPSKFPAPLNAGGQTGAYPWSLTSDELWAYKDLFPYKGIHATDKGNLPQDKTQLLTWGYLAAVSSVDYNVGLLMKGLKDSGLDKNTIIVLVSDHGFKLGEHGYWAKKSNAEVDIRTPLIIVAPNWSTPGTRVKGLVEAIDLYPTLAEMAGITAPSSVEGLSLTPLFSSPDRRWKSAAFAQFPRYARESNGNGDIMGYTVRTANYRYTAWIRKSDNAMLGQELYDHVSDYAETTNVATNSRYAAVLSTLEQVRVSGWKPVRDKLKS